MLDVCTTGQTVRDIESTSFSEIAQLLAEMTNACFGLRSLGGVINHLTERKRVFMDPWSTGSTSASVYEQIP